MKKLLRKILRWIYPELGWLSNADYDFTKLRSWKQNVKVGKNVRISPVYLLSDVVIGDYSYISSNSIVSNTNIGKFCSIGPNFLCGWGLHPTNGLSTSPVFYSKEAKYTFSEENKINEHPQITIGNDVFIGANVTVLEGIQIGDGAIIGAGAVVSKDIPPYAIAVGCPIQIKNYRFSEEVIAKLQKIKWWDFDEEKLKEVERMFFEVEKFLEKYGNK